MNKRVKKIWVAALRSGEYKQTTGVLRNNRAFCCLGVLCDLYVKETGTDPEEVFDSEDEDLPDCVTEWAGTSADPLLGKHQAMLHNDGNYNLKPKDFSQIANLIQRYL